MGNCAMRPASVRSIIGFALFCSGLVWAEAEYVKVLLEDFEIQGAMRLEGENVHPASKLAPSAQEPHEGKLCAELKYQFARSEEESCLYVVTPHRIGARTYRASVAVRGDGGGAAFGVVVRGDDGELHKCPGGTIDFKGWKVVSVRLYRESWKSRYRKSSRARYAVDYYGLYLEGGGEAASGTVAFDSVTVLSKDRISDFVELEFEPSKPFGCFWGSAAPPGGQLSLRAPRSVSTTLPVMVKLLDSRGKQLAEVLKEDIQVANGTAVKRRLSPKLTGYGAYALEVTCGGRPVHHGICWLASPAAPPEDSPFGVTMHVEGLGDRVPQVLGLAKQMGAKWVRTRFVWETIEAGKGKYVFPKDYDRFFQIADQLGLKTLGVLGDLHPDYDEGKAPTSEEGVRAFVRYAEAVVKRYAKNCTHWEVWNGTNSGRYGSAESPDAYMRLLPKVYRAIKKADPNSTVIGGSVVGIPFPFIEAMMATWLGEGMDVFSVQPTYYSGHYLEYYFSSYTTQLKRKLEAFGAGELNLWLTTLKNSKLTRGRARISGDYAANRFTRLSLVALTMPFVERLFVHTLIEVPGADPFDGEYTHGLLDRDGAPTVGFAAFHTMANALAGKPYRRSISVSDEDYPPYCLEFGGEGDRVLVAWTRRGKHTLSLKTTGPSVVLTTFSGASRTIKTSSGRLMIRLSDEPIYLTGYGEAEPVPALFSMTGPTEVVPGEAVMLDVAVDEALQKPDLVLRAPDGWTSKAESPTKFQASTPRDAAFGTYELLLSLRANEECCTGLTVRLAEKLTVAAASVDSDTVRVTLGHPVSFARTAKRELSITTADGEGGAKTKEESVKLPPNGKVALDIDLKATSPDGIVTARLDVKVTTDRQQTLTARAYSGSTPFYRVAGVKIDGNLSEWQRLRPAILDRKYQYVVSSGPAWGGKEDLAGKFWAGWDDKRFLLAAKVTDDKHVQPYRGYYVYSGDAVRFGISSGEGYQYYVMGVNHQGQTSFCQLSPSHRSFNTGVEARAVRKDKETLYELAVDWSVLGVKEEKRQDLKFGLLIQDRDQSYLRGWLEWFAWTGYRPAPQQLGPVQWGK